LHQVTFTGRDGGDDSWFFYGGPVKDGKWTVAPVRNVVPTAEELARGQDALTIGLFGVDPEPGDGLGQNMSPSTGPSASVALVLDGGEPSKVTAGQLASIHRIDNPALTTPANTDCVSCHASSRLLRQRGVPFLGAGDEYENPAGITGFAELALQQQTGENVRNFGWLKTQPVVTWLTANSSAEVAARVNASQGWNAPAVLDCRSPAVRECFAGRAAGGKKTTGKSAECLKLCRRR
jgi:hypothetical protein